MDWLYYILLLIVQLTGLFLNILGLPGLWLMLGGAGLFAFVTHDERYMGNGVLVVLLVLALAAEAVEFLAGSVAAKKAGSGKMGMVGAIIGALVGGIIGTGAMPVVGTIAGACLGAFVGASAFDLIWNRDLTRATKIGYGAAKGRFAGILLKSAFGILIFLITLVDALPVHWGSRY